MSDAENVAAPVEVDVEAVEEVAKPAEPLDMTSALKQVMKKALAHDGLARGLHEACRAIEKDQAQLCVLAEDCNQPDYKKLIESLCAEKNVDIVSVPENKQLGEMAGLCKLDAEGNPVRVVACSCAVVVDYGESTEALTALKNLLKLRA